jgi:hypothetical protein
MADIQLDSITNAAGTGVFDKLMEAVNTQIESQYLNNRITGSDYANVYLGGMQAVLQQSMQFVLQEQLTEAQIEDVLASTNLKEEQLKATYAERVVKDKQAAKLGLDNVMKTSEESRALTPNFVYTPRYEDTP